MPHDLRIELQSSDRRVQIFRLQILVRREPLVRQSKLCNLKSSFFRILVLFPNCCCTFHRWVGLATPAGSAVAVRQKNRRTPSYYRHWHRAESAAQRGRYPRSTARSTCSHGWCGKQNLASPRAKSRSEAHEIRSG